MSSSSSDDDDLLTSSYVPIAKKRKAKSTTADDERAFAELTESAQGDLEQREIRGVYKHTGPQPSINLSEIALLESSLVPKNRKETEEDDKINDTHVPQKGVKKGILGNDKQKACSRIEEMNLQQLISIGCCEELEGLVYNKFLERYYQVIEIESEGEFKEGEKVEEKITIVGRLPVRGWRGEIIENSVKLVSSLIRSILKSDFSDRTPLEILKHTYENSKALKGDDILTRLRFVSLVLAKGVGWEGNDFKEVGSLMDGIKRNVLGAFVDEDVQRVKEMCGLGKVWAGWKEGSGGERKQKGIEDFF
ncbi:hypothetical protein TrST_g13674 [Triparma strigata]|uniref:Uncharacterized protein n=1 Tax=Triparma strigata TaxID=1606541 RepID=A0A9W7BP55_9STRA|nr:hypothetical protein TrST_g13674 [Triparma strigata]